MGNISKLPVEPVVWSFFGRPSQTRKHKPRRHPRSHKRDYVNPHHWLLEQVGNYKSMCFLKTYITSLFSCKTSFTKQIRSIANDLLPLNQFPQHLLVIARDIARFRLGEFTQVQREVESPSKHFLKVTFHNKGLEMINLSSIVHSKVVRTTIPDFFEDKEPPVITQYGSTVYIGIAMGGPALEPYIRRFQFSLSVSISICLLRTSR